MKVKIRVILVTIIGFVISGCGQRLSLEPTFTPTPSVTPTPSPPPWLYTPVPRWMILGQPFYNVEILGETWKYTDDRWGETYGCISYTRETGTPIYFEQCFALVDNENVSFEAQRDLFLGEDFETLTPQKSFGGVGQISLLGKRLFDNNTIVAEFFEIVGVGKYITLVELYAETVNPSSLQVIYESQAANIMDYVLQDSLQKSRLIPQPTATPLSPSQQSYYEELAWKLITDTEASEIYHAIWMGELEGNVDGTWEFLGDDVKNDRTGVCRSFEDRTNVDVRWVHFRNCVFESKEAHFENLDNIYDKPGDTKLESTYDYSDNFLLYGYNDGSTYFDAYLLDGEFIYHVSLVSRTIEGEEVEDVFNQTIDNFIYNTLMTNVQK